MADEIAFLPLGAIIQSFKVGGVNIVQGFPTQQDYVSHNSPFFGETIGRVANRISGARIASLNGGAAYPLPANNGPNTLHGGAVGWGKRVWDGPRPLGVRPQVPGLPPFASGGETVQFALLRRFMYSFYYGLHTHRHLVVGFVVPDQPSEPLQASPPPHFEEPLDDVR